MALPQLRMQLINTVLHKAGSSAPGIRVLMLHHRTPKVSPRKQLLPSVFETKGNQIPVPQPCVAFTTTGTKDGGGLMYTRGLSSGQTYAHERQDSLLSNNPHQIVWRACASYIQSWRVHFLTLLQVIIQMPKWLANEQNTCNSLTGGLRAALHQQTTYVVSFYTKIWTCTRHNTED